MRRFQVDPSASTSLDPIHFVKFQMRGAGLSSVSTDGIYQEPFRT